VTLIRDARAVLARQPRNATVESPAVPLTSQSLLEWMGPGRTAAGVHVNEQSALGMTAVWRAVNLISGVCAGLPLHAYVAPEDDVRRKVPATSQAARLLSQPHPDIPPFEFWEQIYAHIALWGNAYIRKLRNQNGQIQELWPIHPSRVKAGRESENGTKVYVVDGDESHGYTDQSILHIPGFGYDGICGVSPIRFMRQAVALGLAAETYGAMLFGNGSLASGILQTEQRLAPGAATTLAKRWAEKANGLDNAHNVVVLDQGAKFQALSIPPEDAQFIESRRFQTTEVARMFGIPPHMLMETDASTSWGTGIEQQSIGWNVYDLKRWYTRVEQRVSMMLRPQAVFAAYSAEGLLRGDSAARATFYTQMFHLGVFSTNDIRRLENLPPVEGGDVRYRELNLGELGQPDPGTESVIDDAASVAETVQKVYLGVGPVLTTDEAREIVNAAGGSLPIPKPADLNEPAPVPQETANA
jgi:HK97 family phage portal protein